MLAFTALGLPTMSRLVVFKVGAETITEVVVAVEAVEAEVAMAGAAGTGPSERLSGSSPYL